MLHIYELFREAEMDLYAANALLHASGKKEDSSLTLSEFDTMIPMQRAGVAYQWLQGVVEESICEGKNLSEQEQERLRKLVPTVISRILDRCISYANVRKDDQEVVFSYLTEALGLKTKFRGSRNTEKSILRAMKDVLNFMVNQKKESKTGMLTMFTYLMKCVEEEMKASFSYVEMFRTPSEEMVRFGRMALDELRRDIPEAEKKRMTGKRLQEKKMNLQTRIRKNVKSMVSVPAYLIGCGAWASYFVGSPIAFGFFGFVASLILLAQIEWNHEGAHLLTDVKSLRRLRKEHEFAMVTNDRYYNEMVHHPKISFLELLTK